METATERIVVQVTPGQKREIVQLAERLGLNVSELMRQAAQGFTHPEEEEEILALVDRVDASAKEACEALDDALSIVEESNRRIATMKGGIR
uniref:plasmid mobilization protein n=1 Tax=Burkholderia arboris TaxID=488730 RepID=UPI003BEEC720